ncbi:MAG: TadE/TadG family type IV pilus assembly protein [Methylocella sp.]
MASLLKKLISDDRGAAIVEAAVTFPVLLTLGLGVFEFSNAFYDHQEITTGVRDAARYMARVPGSCADATAVSNATNLAVNGAIAGGTPRVSGWTGVAIGCATVANPLVAGERTYRGGDPNNNYAITIVTVTASVPYQGFGLLSYRRLTPPTFTLAHSERSIGD